MKEVKTEDGKEKFLKEYSVTFKRWLAREIRAGRMTIKESLDRFDFESRDAYALVWGWVDRYSDDLMITLPVMTDKERVKLEALQRRIKEHYN